jgi:hypothetical protein
MRTAEILIALVCLQLLSTMAQSQRTIRVYNFSPMSIDERFVPLGAPAIERLPYSIELPSKQTFFLARSLNVERLRGFRILNFDTALLLKIRFIDNVTLQSERSIFKTEQRTFDTSIVLHPDSIAFNDVELVRTVQNSKAWLTPQDARNNKKMWKRHNRIRWIFSYDVREKWAKVHK